MLPRKIEETYHWSPSQKEVDAYIDFLEYELLQQAESMPERSGIERHGPAPTKNHPSSSFAVFWGLLAIAAGCFWWLAAIISKAVN